MTTIDDIAKLLNKSIEIIKEIDDQFVYNLFQYHAERGSTTFDVEKIESNAKIMTQEYFTKNTK